MDDIETSNVLLSVHNNTSPPHVTSPSDHNDVSSVEFDEVDDFALLEVEFDGIVSADGRVGVPDGAAVVGDHMGNTLGTDVYTSDFEEFVGSFLRCDAVDSEATLDIVQQTEVLARLFDGDDI